MAKGRYINTHFWDDSYIIELDPIEKLLFLYLLTNPCTDICGAYEISLRRMAFDTGIDRDMLLKVLERFETANKIIHRDGWILVVNFLKNQVMNPSVKAGALRSGENCPDWIKDRILNGLDSLGTGCTQDALPNATEPNSTVTKAEGLKPTDPIILPPCAESEVDAWLDATAPLTGAKDRRTMASPRKWRTAVQRAIRDQRSLPEWLDVVSSEVSRTQSTPQFFSPEGCLKVLQSRTVKSKKGFAH